MSFERYYRTGMASGLSVPEATFAAVMKVTGDASKALAAAVVLKQEWDESKHPRDESGKWTEGGGGGGVFGGNNAGTKNHLIMRTGGRIPPEIAESVARAGLTIARIEAFGGKRLEHLQDTAAAVLNLVKRGFKPELGGPENRDVGRMPFVRGSGKTVEYIRMTRSYRGRPPQIEHWPSGRRGFESSDTHPLSAASKL